MTKQLIIVRPKGIGKMTEFVKRLRPEVHIEESDCQKRYTHLIEALTRIYPECTGQIKTTILHHLLAAGVEIKE